MCPHVVGVVSPAGPVALAVDHAGVYKVLTAGQRAAPTLETPGLVVADAHIGGRPGAGVVTLGIALVAALVDVIAAVVRPPVLEPGVTLALVGGVCRPADLVDAVGVGATVVSHPGVPAGVGALVEVAAADVGLEVLVSRVAGTGPGAVAVGAGRVLAAVDERGLDEPVVRTLVNVETPPVRPRPNTLVTILTVQVRLTAVLPVATPGLGSAPPPAADVARLVAVYLRQVGEGGEREVGPVCTTGPAAVVVPSSRAVGVASTRSQAMSTGPVRSAPPLAAVVRLVPGASCLGGTVVSPALEEARTLRVIVTVSFTFNRFTFFRFPTRG